MDDDIDIEEHDVMDNPRIKSIFPDLSRVKIEIPDDDQDIEDQYDETIPSMEEPTEMLYQYEYSFETTTEHLQDDSEEFDEHNTYLYNNEIILGSKPAIDPEVLYEEALNSHPFVYLENWEDKLKSSPCYCNTCNILFPTVNALDAHKMISHSYLIALDTPQRNTARKSTSTSKYCNHCSKTFPDDTSLIKHLYELLPTNNFTEEKDEEESHPKVKKMTPTTLQWPKKIKSTSHVITKIHPRKIKIEPKVKIEEVSEGKDTKMKIRGALQRDGKFFATSSLLPKSTLFQCNVCQIGFISCFGALQHSKSCEKVLPFDKCGVCKRKIKKKDMKIHVLQHNFNDKLKIYTVNKSMYDRVLCKCPKCLACFDELGFWAHYQKCKKIELKKSIVCPDCDINISSIRYRSHRLKHSLKKLTKKDFIVIEFHDHKNIKMNEMRLESVKGQRLKEKARKYREKKLLNLQNEKDITLYYCEFCGCCQYILNYKGHTDGSCKEKWGKKFCDQCGLCFSAKSIESHLVLHEKRSFSLKDVKIISLTTGKSIDPPMPELFKCKKCNKHFLYQKTEKLHDCKTEKYITCKICTKKFNVQAYKIHKIFHSVDKLLPELMKKYNSINSMWNIMFMCSTCELVTMTYDSAVSHSQGHLNYIISDLHKLCEICDLRIAEKEYLIHENLHTNNDSIKRSSFKILKYKYEDLFKKEWMGLFKDLPKQDRLQILSKSIYRHTRSVKMHVEISAPTEDTKYFCMKCNTFVDGANINQHILSKCLRNNKYVCNICHEIFKSLKLFLSHEGSHGNEGKRQTIVTFNNECDKESNNHLKLIASKSKPEKVSKDMPLSKLREILTEGSKKTYKIYKCAKCETCVSLQKSIRRHHCIFGAEKRFCDICGQYFSSKKTAMHIEAHRKKPSITKDMLYVVYFNGVEKKPEPVKVVKPKSPVKKIIAKIFECECGLHFTSMKSIEKHVVHECEPKRFISKETCSKCQLVFPTEVLVTHLINHHSKETKIEILKIVKIKLFKCPHCALLFTSMSRFEFHTENCDPKIGVQCADCRLTFGKSCYTKHLCVSRDVKYINKITTIKKVIKQATVFKCKSCDINFLRQRTLQYHVDEANHRHKKPPLVCKVCGLKFTNCSYQKHIRLHSFRNENYKIKVVNPGGEFVFLTGNNSDIYHDNTEPNDSKRSSPRKRKLSNTETDSALDKKVKVLNDRKSSTRKSIKTKDEPSTSKESDISNDVDNDIIIPDKISQYTDNINNDNEDTSIISPNKNDASFEKPLSKKVKSRILVNTYTNKLYRCINCNQHYMKDSSFEYHVKNHKSHDILENFKCDICHLDFSRHTLPRHKYVHHDEMGLKLEDFVILTETYYIKESEILKRYKNLKPKVEKIEIDDSGEIHDDIVENCDDPSVNSDNKIDSENNHSANNLSENNLSGNNLSEICDSDLSDNIGNNEKICYYKCADCNVCFVNHTMCYQHTFKHEILDPMTYIQCKICDFQFLIDSLKEHMTVHHKTEYRIANLTIHEYIPVAIGLEPKIDIYQAVDKVQSRLISTTTDVGVV